MIHNKIIQKHLKMCQTTQFLLKKMVMNSKTKNLLLEVQQQMNILISVDQL
jgi:hypothetical protein